MFVNELRLARRLCLDWNNNCFQNGGFRGEGRQISSGPPGQLGGLVMMALFFFFISSVGWFFIFIFFWRGYALPGAPTCIALRYSVAGGLVGVLVIFLVVDVG